MTRRTFFKFITACAAMVGLPVAFSESSENYSILDFARDTGILLYPVQKAVLKFLYGLPLDSETVFRVQNYASETNPNSEMGCFPHTECSYADLLFAEGRISIQRPIEGFEFRNGLVIQGRSSGASYLNELIHSFEVFRSLRNNSESFRSVISRVSYYGWRESGVLVSCLPHIQKHSKFHHSIESALYFYDEPSHVRASIENHRMCDFRGQDNSLVTILDPDFHLGVRQNFLGAQASLQMQKGKLLLFGYPRQYGFLESLFENVGSDFFKCRIPTWEMNSSFPLIEFSRLESISAESFRFEFGAGV